MKTRNIIAYLLLGVIFGIVLSKSEAISWFRIQEMFRFESFHMYGLIGSAVVTGVICVQIIKRFDVKDFEGNPIIIQDKQKGVWRYLLGGTSFGMGWALVGGCTAPMFILIGYGQYSMLIILFFALIGTYLYGRFRDHLPH